MFLHLTLHAVIVPKDEMRSTAKNGSPPHLQGLSSGLGMVASFLRPDDLVGPEVV